VKVRLGNVVQDIYYIGTTGIAKEHPYYAQAVAAHKALVVGQKVTALDGRSRSEHIRTSASRICIWAAISSTFAAS